MAKKLIGFAQFDPKFGCPEENRATIQRLAEENAEADLLVFPELCTTGYEFHDRAEVLDLAETFEGGATCRMARRLASKLGVTLVVGYAERDGDRTYNSSMLVTPGAHHKSGIPLRKSRRVCVPPPL